MTTAPPAPATRPRRTAGPRRPAQRHDTRRTLLAVFATFLGCIPLCELFTDSGWLVDVALAMLVAVGPAAALRTRHAPSALQIWLGVVLLVPWLTLNFLRDSAYGGIVPSGATGHELSLLLDDLHRTTSEGVAPVHTTVAVRLVLCAVLALVAALVDLVAVVGRRGALAGVPLLVVYAVSGAVSRHPVAWPYFVIAAAGFLILLGLDASDDLDRWGHRVAAMRRTGNPRARTGQRLGLVAVLVAVVVPLALPADRHNVLTDAFHQSHSGSGGGDGSSIDPFAGLRGELRRGSPLQLFTATISTPDGRDAGSAAPFYLRELVLPVFTGDGWVPGGDTGPVDPASSSAFEQLPGVPGPAGSTSFTARLVVSGLRANPPVFAVPTGLSGAPDGTTWNPGDELLQGSQTDTGQVIVEQVRQPEPTTRELRAARGSDPALAASLQLPPIAPDVRSTTARIVRGAATPYDRALAIDRFFTDPANGFVYSLQVPLGDSVNALADFLQTRTGFCQQYAAAMAVMLRLSGVPSRVVLGYTHPEPDGNGRFVVTSQNAHAWVEAWFSGIGWVPFDPTPAAGFVNAQTPHLAWVDPRPGGAHASGSAQPTLGQPTVNRPGIASASTAPTVRTRRHHVAAAAGSAAPVVAAVAGAVLLALLAAPWTVREARRRRRLAAAARGDAEAAWTELADTARDLGLDWSNARTPRQVTAWLHDAAGPAAGAVAELAGAVERARYAPAPAVAAATPAAAADGARTEGAGTVVVASRTAARPNGAALARAVGEARHGLRAGVGRGRRWRATLWPASLRAGRHR